MRVRHILDYIDRHLDDRLTLAHLSAVAGLSKFHFHRRFSQVLGLSVSQYIRRQRLHRAAFEIAFRNRPIVESALASGYGSLAAFSRAFTRVAGCSPAAFRAAPCSGAWLDAWAETQRRLDHLRRPHATAGELAVRTTVFPTTRVAALEHRGDPGSLNASLQRFIAWRRRQLRRVRTSATFNLAYNDPNRVPSEHFAFDVCAAIDRPVAANTFGVVEKTIAGGRCAVVRHVGANATLDASVFALTQWVRMTGAAPRHAPLILHRVRLFPDVPEHEAVTDVLMPLA
jgi:AraC family transcriptional regulator